MVWSCVATHRYWGATDWSRARKEGCRAAAVGAAVYRCLLEPGHRPQPFGIAARQLERWSGLRHGAVQFDLVWGSCWPTQHAKALTGVDDHSRFCVSCPLMPREPYPAGVRRLPARAQYVRVPEQVLTDNAGVHGKFGTPGRGAVRTASAERTGSSTF